MKRTPNINLPVYETNDKFYITDMNETNDVIDKKIGDLQETINNATGNSLAVAQEIIEARGNSNSLGKKIEGIEAHKTKWINVVEKGVDNTGASNTSDKINQLIQENDYGTLYFPPGIYNIDKTILINNYINLKLDPMATFKCVSVIDNMIHISRTTERIKQFIYGGVINGNGMANRCIYSTFFANFEIKNIIIKNALTENVYLFGGYEMYFEDIQIDNEVLYSINPSVVGLKISATDSVIKNVIVKNNTVGIYNTQPSNEFYSVHIWCNSANNQGDRRAKTVGAISESNFNGVYFYADSCSVGLRLIGYSEAKLINSKFLYPENFEGGAEEPLFLDNISGSVECLYCTFGSYGKNVRISNNMGGVKIISSTFSAPFNTVSTYKNIRNHQRDYYRITLTQFTVSANSYKAIRIPITGISYRDFCSINLINCASDKIITRHYLYDNQLCVIFTNLDTSNYVGSNIVINAEIVTSNENNIVPTNISYTVV